MKIKSNIKNYLYMIFKRVVKGGLDHVSRKIKRSFHNSRKAKT